jgi:hypothetical protein
MVAGSGTGAAPAGVTVTVANADVKTVGVVAPVISITNKALAPVGSDVVKGVNVLSSRKNENESGIEPARKFELSVRSNVVRPLPNVMPCKNSLKKSPGVVSTRGGLVSEPVTSPDMDDDPNTPVVANPTIVAVLLCSASPLRKSKARNPDVPASGVVLTDT